MYTAVCCIPTIRWQMETFRLNCGITHSDWNQALTLNNHPVKLAALSLNSITAGAVR